MLEAQAVVNGVGHSEPGLWPWAPHWPNCCLITLDVILRQKPQSRQLAGGLVLLLLLVLVGSHSGADGVPPHLAPAVAA